MNATVYASSGSTVNLRERPDIKSRVVEQVAIHSSVDVKDAGAEWSSVSHQGKSGYMMTKFLKFNTGDTIEVSREKLEQIYKEIGELLRQ